MSKFATLYRPFWFVLLLFWVLYDAKGIYAYEPWTIDDAEPLPNGCTGVTEWKAVPVCCAFGYVYDGETGNPMDDVQLHIQSQSGQLTTSTRPDADGSAPYFAVNLSSSPLSVEPGEPVTITASYNDQTVSKYYEVAGGGQQIDLVIPTLQGDQAPIATIHYIHPTSEGSSADSVRFFGSGADRDSTDGTTSGEIVAQRWESNLDGQLNTEGFFTRPVSNLSDGIHTITYQVKDNEGAWSTPISRPFTKMTYDLSAGWNVINLPVLPQANYNSNDLMDDIGAAGGCADTVATWHRDNWRTALHHVPVGILSLSAQTPYFVKTSCPSTSTLVSISQPHQESTITIQPGWNFVTLPHTAPSLHAEAACTQIANQGGQVTQIAQWDTFISNWRTHICNTPVGNFTMQARGDYFMLSDLQSVWIPQEGEEVGQFRSLIHTENQAGKLELQALQVAPDITSQCQPTISDVRVTNLSSRSASITWLSDRACSGEVDYGTAPEALGQTAIDDRGIGIQSTVHHVTLTELNPETTYYFRVQSGDTEDDNGGESYQLTTGPDLSIPDIHAIYGRVIYTDGTTPVADIIVYITIVDSDGTGNDQSAPLSGLTNATGYWEATDGIGALNLASARTEDGTTYFTYSPEGDQLKLEAVAGSECNSSIQTDINIVGQTESVTLDCSPESPSSETIIQVQTIIQNGLIFPDSANGVNITVGDLTNNGTQDLIIAKGSDARLAVFQNASGTWDEGTILLGPTEINASRPFVAPIRNDGQNWLVYDEHRTGNTGEWLRSHRFEGTRRVENKTIETATVPGHWPGWFGASVADLDQDEKLEIWVQFRYGVFPDPTDHLRRYQWDPESKEYAYVEIKDGADLTGPIRQPITGDFLGNGTPGLVWAAHRQQLDLVTYTPGEGVHDHTSLPIYSAPTDIRSYAAGDVDGLPGADVAVVAVRAVPSTIALISGNTFSVTEIITGLNEVVEVIQVADLDADGQSEIYAAGKDGGIYTYDTSQGFRLLAQHPNVWWLDGAIAQWTCASREEVLFVGPLLNEDGTRSNTFRIVSIRAIQAESNSPPCIVDGEPHASNEGTAVPLSYPTIYDQDWDELTYTWSIDTDQCTIQEPTNFYTDISCRDNGNHLAQLLVSDGHNSPKSHSVPVTIHNVAPTIDAPQVQGTAGDGCGQVTARATFSDRGENDGPFTCTVDYGDGSGAVDGEVTDNLCTGPSYRYRTDATYTITLSVTDKDGDTGTAEALSIEASGCSTNVGGIYLPFVVR
ncbi:MAG: PKD domain-containing protein [Chloroflexota bacterium]